MMKYYATALIAVVGMVEAQRFKSGAVTGYEKFTYGKFITRMKAPNKKGTVSSFFTYWNGPDFYPGGWNELDVEIVPSVSENPLSLNIIFGDGQTKRESHDYMRSFDPKDDWHIYEMAWTPDHIAWSVDNKEVRRVQSDEPAIKYMKKGQSVMMNFWTPTFESWSKGFSAAEMPWYVEYDYVETYTWNTETSGFDFHWRDNFDTFDSHRWHKSDNTTFDANSTTFRGSQAYVKNGHLVLKMEPDSPHTLHGMARHEPASVIPVETEPTYDHTPPKGQKARQEDAHQGLRKEQHMSHVRHAMAPYDDNPHEDYSRGDYSRQAYAYQYDPYNPHHQPMQHYEREDPYAPYHHVVEHVEVPHHVVAHVEVPHHEAAVAVHQYEQVHHEVPHQTAVVKETAPLQTLVQHEAPKVAHHEGQVDISSKSYYDQMFNPHHSQQQEDGFYHDGTQATEQEANDSVENLSIRGLEQLGHLDATPFEHEHSDFEARFAELDRVPHQEVGHDAHGIQGALTVEQVAESQYQAGSQHSTPSYEELLWNYQHQGIDRHALHHGAEVVHHEDLPSELYGTEQVYSVVDPLPLFEPQRAQQEYIMDHGDQHPFTHHFEQDQQFGVHQAETETPYNYEGQSRSPSQSGPFWHDGRQVDATVGQDYRQDVYSHATHPGDSYGHDVSQQDGAQLMQTIEHQYDELFHEIESRTKRGTEHHDLTYKTVPLHRKEHEISHPYHQYYQVAAAAPPQYATYHAPQIHGNRDHEEYHELNHEPFKGDYKHGDLRIATVEDGHLAQMHHTAAYPEHNIPHQEEHHPGVSYHQKETSYQAHHEPAHEGRHPASEHTKQPVPQQKQATPQAAPSTQPVAATPSTSQPAVASKLLLQQ